MMIQGFFYTRVYKPYVYCSLIVQLNIIILFKLFLRHFELLRNTCENIRIKYTHVHLLLFIDSVKTRGVRIYSLRPVSE